MSEHQQINSDASQSATIKVPPFVTRPDAYAMEPFQQRPSDEVAGKFKDKLCANDLFSLFTYEIIIQRKEFVR